MTLQETLASISKSGLPLQGKLDALKFEFETNLAPPAAVEALHRSTNELIAQPDIHSVADLRGKTVIVDAPNTAYALQLKKILLLSTLKAGRDYEIKPIGATPLRLPAALLESSVRPAWSVLS